MYLVKYLWDIVKKYSNQEKQQERKRKLIERLSRKYCNSCNKNGWQTDLYCSVYIRGLYCEDCLKDESDGEGGKLNDHKFEPYN